MAQIFYAIDTKYQRWLGEYRVAKARYEVNDEIVNFKRMFEDILDMHLPDVIKKVGTSKGTIEAHSESRVVIQGGRGQKRKANNESRAISNKH